MEPTQNSIWTPVPGVTDRFQVDIELVLPRASVAPAPAPQVRGVPYVAPIPDLPECGAAPVRTNDRGLRELQRLDDAGESPATSRRMRRLAAKVYGIPWTGEAPVRTTSAQHDFYRKKQEKNQ